MIGGKLGFYAYFHLDICQNDTESSSGTFSLHLFVLNSNTASSSTSMSSSTVGFISVTSTPTYLIGKCNLQNLWGNITCSQNGRKPALHTPIDGCQEHIWNLYIYKVRDKKQPLNNFHRP